MALNWEKSGCCSEGKQNRSKKRHNVRNTALCITIILFITLLAVCSIQGCSGGGGGENSCLIQSDKNSGSDSSKVDVSGSLSEIGPFVRQKWDENKPIEVCNIKFYVKTSEGLVDMSPGNVPENAARVNNEKIYIGSGPSVDSKDIPSMPEWQMFQELTTSTSDPGVNIRSGFANLHAEDVQADNTLTKQAACPYGDNEDLPEGAVRFGDIYSGIPVTLANPGTTSVSYKWIYNSGASVNDITVQYRSWRPDPEKPDVWNCEYRYFHNGSEYWYTGVLNGKQSVLVANPGIGNGIQGPMTHRIEKSTSGEAEASSLIVFERNVIQRKLILDHQFEDIEFTPGDSVSFSNSMVWKNSPNDNSHDGETAPLETENPKWTVSIYDPGGNLIAQSEEQAGSQLAWNWDSNIAVAAAGRGYKTFRLVRRGVEPGLSKPNRAVFTVHNPKEKENASPDSETREEPTEIDNTVNPEPEESCQAELPPETASEPEAYPADTSEDPTPSTETLCEEQDLTEKDPTDNFKEEVAEYSYEITASATSYTAMDTTGGVDVSSFKNMAKKLNKLFPFTVRSIFAEAKPRFYILNEDNIKINADKANPQFNLDSSPARNEPAVLISRDNRQSFFIVEFKRRTTDSDAKYMVWGVCQLHDSSSFRLAQTKKTPLIFKKGSDTASYTFKVSNGTLSVPSSVQKLESIKWYYSTVKDGKADSGKLTDESFCKIYVVLREPINIERDHPPRKDVLDIACEVAKGKKDDDSIRDAMTGGLWGYLNDNGFRYEPGGSHCLIPTLPRRPT
ncbi:MAG: hypothetical protein LWY06_19185, partial [Firmicutes bacterium]|nr:hypothetical protein [Bacillota bacterium]